jgi:heme/copper-type cytochrome/quinol oxidase subunit 2
MTTPNNPNPNPLLISYLTLRKTVGILGIILPIILALGSVVVFKCNHLETSVSNYYYTGMGNVFVAVLCAFALFLFTYNGYEKKDKIAGKLAGIFGIIAAIFPTNFKTDICVPCAPCEHARYIGIIHLTCAALFFLVLAYFSLCLFTKKSPNPTPEKLKRNKIYKICGWVMIVCIVACIPYFAFPDLKPKLNVYNYIFWLETISLWAFGLSWLTKGEAILKDK